jgi:hypothetical protein
MHRSSNLVLDYVWYWAISAQAVTLAGVAGAVSNTTIALPAVSSRNVVVLAAAL